MKIQKKTLFITIAIILAVILAVTAIVIAITKRNKTVERPQDNSAKIKDTETVVLVDDVPLAFAEFKLAAGDVKAQVAAYFYNTYGAEQSPTFWTDEHDGITANQYWYEKALEEAVNIKTEQIMMVEYKVADDISYASFYDSFIEENNRRKRAVANNQIIYGPEQYTLEGYYEYVHNNRKVEIKALINKEVSGTNALDYSEANFLVKYEERRKEVVVKPVEGIVNQLKADMINLVE